MILRTIPEYAHAERLVLDLTAGRIPVTFDEGRSRNGATFAEMTQLDPVFGATHRAEAVAPLLGLRMEDFRETAPQTVSTGVPFCVVVLRTVEALEHLRLDATASERYLREAATHFFYVLAKDGDGWRARMQFYNGEDPATGSAAGCAISYLVKHGLCEPGRTVHLRQGIEMGRRSDLYISANAIDGRVGEVRVGGSTVPVANGRIFLA